MAGLTLEFGEAVVPQLAYYSDIDKTKAVVPAVPTVKTDAKGYAVIDLMRKATYHVTVEGWEDHGRDIVIPDASSAPLPDVLFPVVDRVEWKDGVTTLTPVAAPTLSMANGATKVLTLETVFRSGRRVAAFEDCSVKLSDATKASFTLTGATLTLQAIAAGTTTLEVVRSDSSQGKGVSIEPTPAIRGSIAITVT